MIMVSLEKRRRPSYFSPILVDILNSFAMISIFGEKVDLLVKSIQDKIIFYWQGLKLSDRNSSATALKENFTENIKI